MLANRDSTHAITSNGRTTIDLTELFRSVPDEFERRLRRLDGKTFFTELLWRLPNRDIAWLGELDYDTEATDYLQAGGTAEQMTIELRRTHGPNPGQFVVGRQADPAIDKAVDIQVAGSDVHVGTNEVFDTAEASAIFSYYYVEDSVPQGYELRRLDLPE